MANQISGQTRETLLLVTSAVNIHLNIGQKFRLSTSSVFMSVETTSITSLSNKLIEQVGQAQIQLPSDFQLNSTNSTSITLRVNLPTLDLSLSVVRL